MTIGKYIKFSIQEDYLNLFNLKKRISFICITLIAHLQFVYAHITPVNEYSKNTIKLIENKGQWEDSILFKAQIPGGTLFITENRLIYSMIDEKALHDILHNGNVGVVNGHNYAVQLKGASKPTVRKYDPSSEYYNYFRGKDPNKWKSGCRAYGKIVLENIYPGIDMEIIALDERLKINFHIKPLANPDLIKLSYSGVDDIKLHNQTLEINTAVAAIRENAPIGYQPELGNAEIPVSYVFAINELSFDCSKYNRLFPFIIDPEIVFGTFSGSIADNFGFTATYDLAGNGYAGGTVYNINFPTTLGAFQLVFNGGDDNENLARDCGILKFNPNGTNLVYCTYLGGDGNEQPHSMVCNPSGELIVFGSTHSDDFPVSNNGYDKTYNGEYDIFVTRFNAAGTALIGSTYFGGSTNDGINGNTNYVYDPNSAPLKYNFADQFRGEVVLDNFGNIVIVSATRSTIPIQNGFQTTIGGLQDGLIARFSSSLNALQFSSYLGGSGHDAVFGIAVDALNNYFITGGTTSNNLTPTNTSFTRKGGVDAFVAKISGNSLQRFLYFGTNTYDQSYLIQVDKNGDPYICGQTESIVFPLVGSTYRVTGAKQFISKFNNDLDQLLLSTTFGKGGTKPTLSPTAFLIDICGRIYFSGWGGETNQNSQPEMGNTSGLPTTFDAFQTTTDGSDFYLAVFSPEIKTLSYATFIGDPFSADHVDGGTSRFNPEGIVYQSVCAGCGGSSGFPTTPNAWSTINKGKRTFDPTIGGCNNALLKMSLDVSIFAPEMKDTLLTIIAGDSLNFTTNIIDRDNDSIYTSWSGTFLFATPNQPTVNLQRFANINGLSIGSSRLTLRWRSDCSNIGDTFLLRLFTYDNGCPVTRSDTAWIRVAIAAPPLSAIPFPECLSYISDSVARIKWDPVIDVNTRKIRIYRAKATESSLVYKVFDNRFETLFIDSLAYNHQEINYCYYLTTLNQCDIESSPSRTICSMYKEDTATTQAFFNANDTIVYVFATDTLQFTSTIWDTDNADSVYVSLSGNVFNTGRLLSHSKTQELGKATFTFSFRSVCEDIGADDTLFMQVFAIDNQCPTPRNKTFKVKIIVLPPPAGVGPGFRCIKRIDNNTVDIGFKVYNPNKYFSHLVVIRKNPNGTFTTVRDLVKETDVTITDVAEGHEFSDYCYAAYPVTICGNIGDTSAFICSVSKPEDFPAKLRIFTVTVVDNKSLEIQWQPSSDTGFSAYKIYRKPLTEGQYELINSANNNANSNYLDEQVEVSKQSYCYQIRQQNVCGLESLLNDEACSIHLKGISLPFEHQMTWNPYLYWPDGVEYYSVAKEEPGQSPVIAGNITADSTLFTDNKLNIDNGIYFYSVTAHEPIKSLSFTSRSNTIELIQSPLLYVPNAFTPNTDGTNDLWKPRPVFVKDYDLKLYNRWGQLVFSTNDKYEFFDGTKDGVFVLTDVYVYVITYTGWDGSTKSTSGNVTLIR